jgi:hypothetical protein
MAELALDIFVRFVYYIKELLEGRMLVGWWADKGGRGTRCLALHATSILLADVLRNFWLVLDRQKVV